MRLEELQEYALLRGLNLGQAEKDYFQNILLFILYQHAGKELVFKGGTALAKCYGLNRFSEDLDFSAEGREDYAKWIKSGLDAFSIRHRVKGEKGHPLGQSLMVKIEGPLYKGHERTLCSISIEASLREKMLFEPKITAIAHHMDVIPAFDVYVMDEREIMLEKTHAIMARTSARDLFDLKFLVEKGLKIGKKDVGAKLASRGMEYGLRRFEKRCRAIKGIWESELKSLVKNVPDFEDSLRAVLEYYRGLE